MPPQSDSPTNARRWLRYARANIAHAEAGRAAGIMTEYLCFDAQQAAEKALKAALISRGVHFPRVHDLGELLRLLKDAGLEAPDLVKEAVILNPFAAQVRYPGWGEPPTAGDLEEALSVARAVIDWAAHIVEAGAE